MYSLHKKQAQNTLCVVGNTRNLSWDNYEGNGNKFTLKAEAILK